MRSINGFNFAVCGVLLLLLASALDSQGNEVGSSEPSSLTLWERIVSGVKNYPWRSDMPEKESPEVAHRRSVVWQRLTVATVL